MQAVQAPEVVVVDIPDAWCLQIDGRGSPSSAAFSRALDALTDVAHTLHGGGPIEPLETLWWWGDPNGPAPPDDHEWMWTLLIRQPTTVSHAELKRALEALRERHGPLMDRIRLDRFREGRCVQTMHVGPYARELDTLDHLHHEMRRMGFVPAGKHHEIYLDDPRTTPPERLRTVLRRPVRWADEG